MAKITEIKKYGYSYNAGLRLNDDIIEINGIKNLDFLHLALLDETKYITIKVMRDNSLLNFIVKKPSCSKLDFSIDLNLEIRECENRCLFCFVEQLPCGMRESLYVKDDDYRLSFSFGSYITLTNLKDEDINRIIELKISPLYISFHAFDAKIRRKLLGNINADKTLEYIKILYQNKIKMHMQIVLVENINSHEILRESLSFLESLRPFVISIAIVPVGITKHREKLFKLNTLTKECAVDCINIAREFYIKNNGFVWCSDEMYILAQENIENDEYYKNYDQIENGVGLIRTFENELNSAIDDYYYEMKNNKNVIINNLESIAKINQINLQKTRQVNCVTEQNVYKTNSNKLEKNSKNINYVFNEKKCRKTLIFNLITGVSFYPFLKNYAKNLQDISNKKINVFKIENYFFGNTITVAGLLTGEDIYNQLKNKIIEGDIVIPNNMLREFSDTFLDGMKVYELEIKLNKKIHVCHGGEDLFKIIMYN